MECLKQSVSWRHLLLIHAFPGTGKTTYFRRLIRAYGVNVIDTDDFYSDDDKPYDHDMIMEILFKIQVRTFSNLPFIVLTNLWDNEFVNGCKYIGFTTITVFPSDEIYNERFSSRSDLSSLFDVNSRYSYDQTNFDFVVSDFNVITEHLTRRIESIPLSGVSNALVLEYYKFDSWSHVMMLVVLYYISLKSSVALLDADDEILLLLRQMVSFDNITLFSKDIIENRSVLDNEAIILPIRYYNVLDFDYVFSLTPRTNCIYVHEGKNSIDDYLLYDLFYCLNVMYGKTNPVGLSIGISRCDPSVYDYYVSNVKFLLNDLGIATQDIRFPLTLRVRQMTPLVRSIMDMNESEFKQFRTLAAVQMLGSNFTPSTNANVNAGTLLVGRRAKKRLMTIDVSGHLVNILLGERYIGTSPYYFMLHVEENVRISDAYIMLGHDEITKTYESSTNTYWHSYYDYVCAVRAAEIISLKLGIELNSQSVDYCKNKLEDVLSKYPSFRYGGVLHE